MSYCRWSDLNFKCDLYCYAGQGFYVTHVAGRKYVGDPPELSFKLLMRGYPEEFLEAFRRVRRWMETAPMTDILLPHAGESFNDPTLGCFLLRLLWLKDFGYRFPDEVIDQVIEELNDGDHVIYEFHIVGLD